MPNQEAKIDAKAWVAEHALLVSASIVVLALFVGWIVLFQPAWHRARLADRRGALEQERAAKATYLAKLAELDKAYSSFAPEDVARIQAMIPPEEDVPGLLATLETSSRDADIGLDAVNFSASDLGTSVAGLNGLSAMNISMSLSKGNYDRFKLFLAALETNLRIFDVRNVSLNPAAASYALTIRAYMRTKPL